MGKDTFTLAELADYGKTPAPAPAAQADSAPAAAPVAPVPPAAAPAASAEVPPVAPTPAPAPAESPPAVPAASSGEPVASPAAPTPAAAEPAVSAPPSETGAPETPPKGGARERIEGLIEENKALRRYGEYLLTRLPAAAQAAPAAPVPVTPPAAPVGKPAPTLAECGFDTNKWTTEMQRWTAEQIQVGVQTAVQTAEQTREVTAAMSTFESRARVFAAKTPDFKIVTENPALPPLHQAAADLIVQSEKGPEIFYHLGQHPDKAARIARMKPHQQAGAIGRLEAELSVVAPPPPLAPTPPPTPPAPKPTPKPSSAPPPPTPVPSGTSPTQDPMTMSMKDFVAWDRAQQQAKREMRRTGRH